MGFFGSKECVILMDGHSQIKEGVTVRLPLIISELKEEILSRLDKQNNLLLELLVAMKQEQQYHLALQIKHQKLLQKDDGNLYYGDLDEDPIAPKKRKYTKRSARWKKKQKKDLKHGT